MSDSEDIDELEQNQDVQNISVFRKREKVHANDEELIEMDSLKKLNHMLTCPICLDIFQEPVYVKGCSHRFCKECIEKAIRSSKMKQCPTCRKIIGTKRLLRVDFNVQKIINLIYGDITKFLEQKQTNDEMLLQKTYSQLSNNADGSTRKRRKHPAHTGTEKGHDNYQQSSPTYANTKEDSNGKGIVNGQNGINYKNNSSNQQDQNNFSSAIKKKMSGYGAYQNGNSSQQGNQKSGEKGGSSQNEQGTSRKRKLESLGQQESGKKGDDNYGSLMGYKKRYFEEELKEKHQEEEMKRLQSGDDNFGFSNGTSSTNASSLGKIERAFINIQIKVISFDKLQKQFDFDVCKLDWKLSLDDLAKIICQKLNLSYIKYKPYIKFYTKSQAEDSFYHPLEDKTQILKNVEDQFWSVETKQKYIRPYDKNEQAVNLANDYIHQKAAQNRILYYIIDHKDTSHSN